jgi:hypothetical protein
MDLMITNADEMLTWEEQWQPSVGVSKVDFLADVRNLQAGAGGAVALKPAIQFAEVRTDRPGTGAAITAGAVITASGLTHYTETLSASSQFFFRRGWSYKLTAGSFARVSLLQYTSYRGCGKVFAPRELVMNPTNSTDDVSYFSTTGPFAAVGVDKARYAIIGQDNANAKLEYRVAGRAFNDPKARGAWTNLGAGWTNPAAGDFVHNTGDTSLSGLSLASYQWGELALAVRKQTSGDPNSRCTFQIIPALTYA